MEYITKTVKTVGDYPYAWDAVNEAISDNHNELLKESVWKHIPDLVCKVFKTAKAANPKIKFFYNDYNIIYGSGWQKSKTDKVFNFVKDLKERDCGIDGVGF